jgi:hypothetical protein
MYKGGAIRIANRGVVEDEVGESRVGSKRREIALVVDDLKGCEMRFNLTRANDVGLMPVRCRVSGDYCKLPLEIPSQIASPSQTGLTRR